MQKLIDINVSYGHWPFQALRRRSLAELGTHLRSEGIVQAFVAHLATVFLPDPEPSNLALIEEAANVRGIHPVPVVNPALPGWQQHLDDCRRRAELKAIKIYPTFHNYRLTSDLMSPLVAYVRNHNLRLLVSMRLEDERMRFFALDVLGLPLDDVVAFHKQYSDVPFVCLNAYLPEARRIGRETKLVGVDTSFTEWFFTMEELLKDVAPERLFFGSHSPFLYAKAGVMKLTQSRLDDESKTLIGAANAARHFRLQPS